MAEDEKKEMPFITKALIIAIMAVVVVIVSAGISFFIVNSTINKLDIQESEGKDTKKTKEATSEGPEVGLVETFGEFTVNLDEEMPRYLVCTIEFEFDASGEDQGANAKAKVISDAEGNPAKLKVVVKDKILAILRSKSIADLNQDEGLKKLREDIMKEVNKLLGSAGSLNNVYFSKWVIQ